MTQFKDQEIVSRILLNLVQMFESWGLDTNDWLIENKFFYKPYLHNHPATAYHQHLHIIINKQKIPWQINKDAYEIIPPGNSKYWQDYLTFTINFTELQICVKNENNFFEYQRNCDDMKLGKFTIQQLTPLMQLEAIFSRALHREKSTKHEAKNVFSVTLNKDLALYLHLGYLYSLKSGDMKLLKFINGFQQNRLKRIEATIVNDIKARGYAKLFVESGDNDEILENQILILGSSTNKLIPVMLKSAGIICEQGGAICHTSIVCREFNLPGAVGIKNIYNKFRNGDYIEINPQDNCIYILEPFKCKKVNNI